MFRQFTLAFLLVLFSLPAFGWEARVVSVADGDTITVEPIEGGDRVKIRLWGIDCPETNQPYGQVAKGFVNDKLLFKQVRVESKGTDRYKRTVAIVTYPEGEGLWTIQETLLRNGLAWLWPRYCKDAKPCNKWAGLQKASREKHLGLWEEDSPIPPWEWRRQKKRK